MKTRIIILLVLSFLSFTSSSNEPEAEAASDVKKGQEFIEAVQDTVALKKVVTDVGVIPVSCAHCPDKEAHQKILADNKDINIWNPYYSKSNQPYILRLTRTSKSPQKLKLKFKNGYKVCKKIVSEPNPWANGKWVTGCWIEGMDYTKNDIEIDFSKLPPLKENESEVVEVKFFKNNPDKYKYSVTAEILNRPEAKSEVSSYFFGAGFDVKFTEEGAAP